MDQRVQQLPGVVLGEITGMGHDGRPLVRADRGAAARPATFAGCGPAPDWRTLAGAACLLAFADGDPDAPFVIGVIGGTPAARTPRTLRVAAGDELILECGKAKIQLRADGRVEIRGEHVVSRSRGPNKVKGGSVHIN